MAKLSKNNRTVINHLLTKVPTILPNQTVGQTLKLIRQRNNWESINYIYVLDEGKELIGVISIKELLRASDATLVQKIMTKNPTGVVASTDREKAAVRAIKYNIKSVPIFKNGSREFIGIIGLDKILEILHKENVEDFLLFSGIAKNHPTVDILKARISKLVKLRLPWLAIGLIGGIIGATLISKFEPTLRKEIATAFFIPVVVYISNAISTQTQALLIRLLSSQKIKYSAFIKKELVVSFVLAFFSALVVSSFSWLWLRSLKVAITLALAISISTLVSVLIAIIIPSTLYYAKKDPAMGSGPFATAIQDVVSILIYLGIATIIIF